MLKKKEVEKQCNLNQKSKYSLKCYQFDVEKKKQLPQVFEIFGGPLGHAALSCHLVKNSGPEKIRNMQIFIIL